MTAELLFTVHQTAEQERTECKR